MKRDHQSPPSNGPTNRLKKHRQEEYMERMMSHTTVTETSGKKAQRGLPLNFSPQERGNLERRGQGRGKEESEEGPAPGK